MSDARPDPLHPGQVLGQRLKALGWSVIFFSQLIDRPYTSVSKIINGHKSITPENALRIAAAFGDQPEYWLRLQWEHTLGTVREKEAEAVDRTRHLVQMYRLLPDPEEPEKLGWIPEATSIRERHTALHDLLGLNPGEDPILDRFTGVGAPKNRGDLLRVNAWWAHARRLAQEHEVKSFSGHLLRVVIREYIFGEDTSEVSFEVLQQPLAEVGVNLVTAAVPAGLDFTGAAQAGNPATLVLPRLWDDFKEVQSTFFQLVHLLQLDQTSRIWLWVGGHVREALSEVEQEAAELSAKLEHTSMMLRLMDSGRLSRGNSEL